MSSAAMNDHSGALGSDCDLRLSRILEHLPAAVYICDRDGLMTYCNQRAVEMWQRTPRLNDPAERYCGAVALFHADGRPLPHDQSWMALAIQDNREYVGEEIVVGRPDGSRVEVRVHAHPHLDEEGNVSGSVNLLVDVTEERKTEERLKQAARTETVSKLLGGLSHEFNNLLTVIGGCAEFALLTTEPSDPNHEVLTEIANSVEKASLLTNQLLAVCKKQIIQPRAVNLDELVRRTGPLLRRIVGEGIQVMNVLDTTDHFVKIDPGQLEQVLLSLTIQAQGAMPAGGVLMIQTECVSFTAADCPRTPGCKPGNFVALSVTEDGSDALALADGERAVAILEADRQAKGNDSGMAAVHQLVRKNGGFTSVSCKAGRGSTFHIYLPLSEPPAAKSLPRPQAANKPDGTETVLVVEDDPAVRATICRSLSRHGYRALEAGDGMEALRLAHLHTGIRLVISDVVMPKMSGHQLAMQLAALNPELKIMFMSGYSEDSVFCKIIGEQNVAFLQKPFSPSDVARAVRNLLDGTPKGSNRLCTTS